jgi:hypothetical protein
MVWPSACHAEYQERSLLLCPAWAVSIKAIIPVLHAEEEVSIPSQSTRRVGVYGCMRVFQTQGASSNLAHCTKVILAKRFRLALLRQRDWFDSNRSHRCVHSIMESVQGYEPWRLEFDSSWTYKCPLSIFGDAPVL